MGFLKIANLRKIWGKFLSQKPGFLWGLGLKVLEIGGIGDENGGKIIIRLKTRFILRGKWGKFREIYSKLRKILGKRALLSHFLPTYSKSSVSATPFCIRQFAQESEDITEFKSSGLCCFIKIKKI